MASYTGNLIDMHAASSDIPQAGRFLTNLRDEQNYLSTEKAYAGSQSLHVGPGGTKDVMAVCAAGSRTISVYVWPPAGNDCGLIIIDPDTGATMGTSDFSASSGDWEQLSVAFTAEAKMYIARLVNFTSSDTDNSECWFDQLEIT